MLELFHFLLMTHSATGSFFSFSSLFFAAALVRGEVVWTPWDVTSGPRFCSGTAEEGESEEVPDLLPVGATLTAVEVSSLMADSMGTLGPVESTVFFSAAWSFGFSTRSRGILVPMGSKTVVYIWARLQLQMMKGFNKWKYIMKHNRREIKLTLKSTLNFFKLSICFLWSGAMIGGPRKIKLSTFIKSKLHHFIFQLWCSSVAIYHNGDKHGTSNIKYWYYIY